MLPVDFTIPFTATARATRKSRINQTRAVAVTYGQMDWTGMRMVLIRELATGAEGRAAILRVSKKKGGEGRAKAGDKVLRLTTERGARLHANDFDEFHDNHRLQRGLYKSHCRG